MVFQAMVSVIAVKIQFNSPRGVRLSFNRPGTLKTGNDDIISPLDLVTYLSMMSAVMPPTRLSLPTRWREYQRRAVLMGVVRQAVKRSAGSLGFMGSVSFAPQAASWMQLSN